MVAAQRDMLAFVASVLDVPDLEYKDRAKMVSNFVQTRTGVSEAQRKALEANALRVLGQNVAVNGAPAGQAPVATASLGAQAGPSAQAGPVAGPGGAKAHPPGGAGGSAHAYPPEQRKRQLSQCGFIFRAVVRIRVHG